MTLNDTGRFRLYLYVLPLSDDASGAVGAESDKACHAPPLRLERLTLKSVLAAGKLARMAFSLPAKPKICWDERRCWLDCSFAHLDGICEPLFRDAEDLLQALSQMQTWVDEWARSPSRTPPVAPKWAMDRGLGSAEVERVADFILNSLATDSRLTIGFSSGAGTVTAVTVPSRATLRLPPPASSAQKTEQIAAKEEYAVWATPIGALVWVSAKLAPASSQLLPVKQSALAFLTVTNATKILPVAGLVEDATDVS